MAYNIEMANNELLTRGVDKIYPTKEELEKAGFEVFIGSDKKGVAASQENFMRVQADVAIADININDYDELIKASQMLKDHKKASKKLVEVLF